MMLPDVPMKSLTALWQPVWNALKVLQICVPDAQHEEGKLIKKSAGEFKPQHWS